MKVTVTTLGDEIYNLDVNGDMELMNFKALLEFESNVPAREMAILSNGRPLHDDSRKLNDYGLKDGDVLLLQRIQGQQGATTRAPVESGQASGSGLPFNIDFGSIQLPGGSQQPSTSSGNSGATSGMSGLPEDPASIREMLLSSPRDLALLKERNPPLAEALLSGDLAKFTTVLQKQQEERMERERQRIRMLSSDPFDADVQSQIAEEIRLKNVESNMETAMEYAPESFGQVVMLYIDCKVNGHPVKAFVDSGAQMTIMSQACAERCNIMRLVDTRWAGIAKGVGTQKIIGRVHLCQIQIGPDFLQSSFSILEEQPMDMLLGLDMLKRHQCVIDLKNNQLVIGTTGTTTPFLGEGELPDHARLNRTLPEPMDEDNALAEALNRSAQEAGLPMGSSSSSSSGPASSGPTASSAASAAPSTSSQATSSPAASQSSAAAASNFPEADVKRLTDYGFPRQQVLEELTKSRGNVDQALAALFAKSFQVP